MKRYDAVIFDLDGTLLDTAEGIYRSVEYVIKKLKFQKPSPEVMRTFIGPPMQHSFARIYGLDKEGADSAAAMFRDRYKEDDILLATPYEGIYDTIGALNEAGIKTAVATYKRQDYAEKILVHFGFDRICDAMCGSDFEGKLTKKDIIDNAIKTVASSEDARIVMVGDSDNDAIGAAERGVDFIAVTYGFGFADSTAAAGYKNIGIASSPKDILRFVL